MRNNVHNEGTLARVHVRRAVCKYYWHLRAKKRLRRPDQAIVHACTIAMVHARTMAIILACTTVFVHACTIAVVSAFTIAAVHACIIAIIHACIMTKITSWPSYSHWAELLSIGQNRTPEKLNAFQVRRGAGLSFPKLQLDCRAPAAGLPSDLYQNSEAGPALTRTEPKD